jgi:hypothetical protein
MNKIMSLGLKKNIILFCSIIISILFVSSVTAVPQVNGNFTINKLDDLNQNKILMDLITTNINLKDLDSNIEEINSLYIFSKILNFQINMIDDSNSNFDNNDLYEGTNNEGIDEKKVISETKDCISSLSNTIVFVQNNNILTDEEYESLNILNKYILKIYSIFKNKFYNENDIIKDKILLVNGILQNIIALILTILQFIVTIIKAILQGFFSLFGGLIKTIGAIIGIIVLILADIQTILLLTGLYVISIGLLSKNIIKTLAGIGAPIFAAISALLSISIGSLLGNLSVAIFSILGVVIILALPIILIIALLYISGYFEEENSDGLLYILASCISYYFKTI